jgi:uroporphyrinogen-III synthase
LRSAGLVVEAVPTIAFEDVPPGGPLDDAAAHLDRYAWVVVTSANGARALVEAARRSETDVATARWATVGSATAAVLAESGINVAFTPALSSGEGIADELPLNPGDRVLLARTDIADDRLPARLRERGADVDEVVAYRTAEAPPASREPISRVFALGPLDAIVFTSGSTLRGLLALLTPQERRVALRSPAWCIGPSTAALARESGFGRVTMAPGPSAAALAASIADALLSEGAVDKPSQPPVVPQAQPEVIQ